MIFWSSVNAADDANRLMLKQAENCGEHEAALSDGCWFQWISFPIQLPVKMTSHPANIWKETQGRPRIVLRRFDSIGRRFMGVSLSLLSKKLWNKEHHLPVCHLSFSGASVEQHGIGCRRNVIKGSWRWIAEADGSVVKSSKLAGGFLVWVSTRFWWRFHLTRIRSASWPSSWHNPDGIWAESRRNLENPTKEGRQRLKNEKLQKREKCWAEDTHAVHSGWPIWNYSARQCYPGRRGSYLIRAIRRITMARCWNDSGRWSNTRRPQSWVLFC